MFDTDVLLTSLFLLWFGCGPIVPRLIAFLLFIFSRGVQGHARQYSAPEMLSSSQREEQNGSDASKHNTYDISFLRAHPAGELSKMWT